MGTVKFKLEPQPTFTASVDVPVPGGESATITCKFRHQSRSELGKLLADRPPDGDYLMAILAGWDLDDEFNRANVDRLIDLHQGAPMAISKVYLAELSKGRLGN